MSDRRDRGDRRMPKTWLRCLLGVLATNGLATAQDSFAPVPVRPVRALQEGGPPEATLPEIEVRPAEPLPPATAAPGPAAAGGEGAELPPFPEGSPAASAAPSGASAESRFPDLGALELGQAGPFAANTGILRGGKSLFETPAAASIRTREEIEARQAPDMFHALQNEVGVLMQSTAAGQASPFMRGLTGQQVLILVDGIRLNNSIFRRGPNQYFNTIDPGMVDHIEVLRGQGSVLWGSDAIGGAINVVTRGADAHLGLHHGDYSTAGFTQYYNTANSSPYSRLNVEGWVGSVGLFGGGSFQNVRDLDTGFDEFSRQPGTN